MNVFLNRDGKVRNLWWVAIFFFVLATFTVPLILLFNKYSIEITLIHQAFIIILTNVLSQLLIRRPFVEILGKPNLRFVENFLNGALVGSALMFLPALILYVGGWVNWDVVHIDYRNLGIAAVMIFFGAVAEEFLFRGFMFQRMIAGLGVWPAQLLMSGLFLLTHLNNPGMTGFTSFLASINIFIASLLFGIAYIKTKSLALPIGLHFMANLTQGVILGFGVSGEGSASLFKPIFNNSPNWITGGSFGLEASIFGLLVLVTTTVVFVKWKGPK